MARATLTRLTTEKLRAHVALLARHHLGLGYLVHKAPLDRRTIWGYLMRTAPVEVDVSLLSIADRLATRGRKAEEAIGKHLEVARGVLPLALDFASVAGAAAAGAGGRAGACARRGARPAHRGAAGRDRRGALRGRGGTAEESRWRGRVALVVTGVVPQRLRQRAIVPMTTSTAPATVSYRTRSGVSVGQW